MSDLKDSNMVIEAIGRRLRLAVIGGGPGSVIGEVHRIAARLDGYYDIVASALSSDPERSRQSGHAIGVPEDRAYSSWQALIENEARRSDLILEPSGLAEDEVLLEVEGCADPYRNFSRRRSWNSRRRWRRRPISWSWIRKL